MRQYFRFILLIGLLLSLSLTLRVAAVVQELDELPLAERGSYGVGVTTMTFVDERREATRRTEEHRELVTEIWYPAINPEGQVSGRELRDAPPDTGGAPYPLVLYSPWMTGSRRSWAAFTRHLASHGFVVAAMDHRTDTHAVSYVDRPMDVLFVLDRLTALADGDLAGVMDTDHVGIAGYSSGSYTAFATNGSRIDPVSVRNWTAAPLVPGDMTDPRSWLPDWDWEELTAYRAQFDPPLDPDANALWPPFTDHRIRAVMPMMGFDPPMFGESGLTAATVPTLLVLGSADEYNPYERDIAYYEHMGAEDRYLLTVINGDHGSTYRRQGVAFHFATAFFGYYLQGREDYVEYLTEEYVEHFDQLAWGMPEQE